MYPGILAFLCTLVYICTLYTPWYIHTLYTPWVYLLLPAQRTRHDAQRVWDGLTALDHRVVERTVSDEPLTVVPSLPHASLLDTRFTVGHFLPKPHVIPHGGRHAAQRGVRPSCSRFTVGLAFVGARFYTFSSERENQAGIHGGYGPLSHHPFHCWILRKV